MDSEQVPRHYIPGPWPDRCSFPGCHAWLERDWPVGLPDDGFPTRQCWLIPATDCHSQVPEHEHLANDDETRGWVIAIHPKRWPRTN